MNTEIKKNPAPPGDWHAAIVENLLDAVVVIDGEGMLRYMNPAARDLIGAASADVEGLPAADMLIFRNPSDQTPTALPTFETFQGRSKKAGSVILTQVPFTPPRGRERIVNAVFTPIRAYGRQILGIIARFRDVTDSVEDARKRRDKQKIEAISVMAASIASEFANWLGLISGHAAAIADNLIPRTRAYEEAMNILQATKRAGGLTKRLLSVARISDEHQGATPEPVNLDAVVRSAANQARTVFGAQGVEIQVKHSRHVPMVLANATQLFDCLVNIFRNSSDAMPTGGTITVDFPAASARHTKRSFVAVRIRDTGAGIQKSVLPRVFDPFYTTKNPTSAMGLGLTVVQTSLEQWGGQVKIRSRPGQGTSLRLFMRPADPRPVDEEKRSMKRPTADILVVDDQASHLNDICSALEAAGYRTHPTREADECIDFYRRNVDDIDLVLIDVVMPGRDGKHVLKHLLRINPQAAIIMISGFSRDYVRNYLKRGVWTFVQKPIDREHLLFAVHRVLSTQETS